MSELARELMEFEPRTIVTLGGPYAGDWHVNEAGRIGTEIRESRAIVLQRADASPEWLSITVSNKSGEWKIIQAAHHDGEGEEREPIAPHEIIVE